MFLHYISLFQKKNHIKTHFCIIFVTTTYFTEIIQSIFCISVTYIMVKGIRWRYKKYDKQNNYPYHYLNSTFVIPNQSNITYITQCNNDSGSPFSQSISTINNNQGNELASHSTGWVHNPPSQNNDHRSLWNIQENQLQFSKKEQL